MGEGVMEGVIEVSTNHKLEATNGGQSALLGLQISHQPNGEGTQSKLIYGVRGI